MLFQRNKLNPISKKRKNPRNLIVVPYGTPNWHFRSDNIRTLLRENKQFLLVYLLPVWGLVKATDFHPTMLVKTHSASERQILKDTAIMARAWLLEHNFEQVIFIKQGEYVKYWDIAIVNTPLAPKVKILNFRHQHFVLRKLRRWL